MLGNDVVITDAQVAEVYFQCLQKEKKYQISDTGAFEFAKRFCVKGRGFICHGCRLFACLPSSIWWLYVKNIHSLRRFSTLVRIGGAGYRVLAKLSHTRSRHFERVLAMYTKPS